MHISTETLLKRSIRVDETNDKPFLLPHLPCLDFGHCAENILYLMAGLFEKLYKDDPKIREAYQTIFKILPDLWFMETISLLCVPTSLFIIYFLGRSYPLSGLILCRIFLLQYLNIMGVQSYVDGIDIVFQQYNTRIWVQEHCLAIPAMVIFAGTVISFRGSLRGKIGSYIARPSGYRIDQHCEIGLGQYGMDMDERSCFPFTPLGYLCVPDIHFYLSDAEVVDAQDCERISGISNILS
jgi:hypothetical protein